jgi:hypothetical protein
VIMIINVNEYFNFVTFFLINVIKKAKGKNMYCIMS